MNENSIQGKKIERKWRIKERKSETREENVKEGKGK